MTEERQRSRPITIMLLSVFTFVVLYVLSIGPMVRFAPKSWHPVLHKIYAPLSWLSQKPYLRPVIDSYVEWWAPKPQP